MNMLDEIGWRKQAIEDAQEVLWAFVAERWPTGAPITWAHGNHLRHGSVVKTYNNRIKVRSQTGKEYWIDLYDVECAFRKQRDAA